MKKRKNIYRFIAILIIISLVCQDLSVTVNASQNNDVETVYMDGIAFEISETKDGIEIDGEFEGEKISAFYSGDENVDVSISEGHSQDEYSLVFEDIDEVVSELIDDVDIDEILSSNSIEQSVEMVEIEDVLDEYPVEIYNDRDELVGEVDFGGYEGQVAITVAGSASYYILSAVVSLIFTYEVYTIIKASTSSKNKAKRGAGKAIPKNKVPGKCKKNKTVKGKNGSLPTTGDANSSTDLYSENGKTLYQRRFYDGKGKVYLDIDFSHGGNHTFPHAHYWIWY